MNVQGQTNNLHGVGSYIDHIHGLLQLSAESAGSAKSTGFAESAGSLGSDC